MTEDYTLEPSEVTELFLIKAHPLASWWKPWTVEPTESAAD